MIPKRTTRGKRLVELDDEAQEADAEFWGQKAWQEVSEDDEIGSDEFSSDEKEDVEDSDIDAVDEQAEERAELEEAHEAEAAEKKRQRSEKNKRKKGVYVDPALRRKAAASKRPRVTKPRSTIIKSDRNMRTSTRHNSIATTSLVSARGKQASTAVKRQREPLVRLTQQQLLEEAARTEIQNQRSLDLMLMLQEEKKRERSKASAARVPRIIYFSSSKNVRRDTEGNPIEPVKKVITFTGISEFPASINAPPGSAPSIPEKSICSITGLPAKYRLPVTGVPFRDVNAYKILSSGEDAGSKKDDRVTDGASSRQSQS